MATQDRRNSRPRGRSRFNGNPEAARAPFPSRAERGVGGTRVRDALDRARSTDANRVVARCPACDGAVRGTDDLLRNHGDLYHAGCALRRTSAGRDGSE